MATLIINFHPKPADSKLGNGLIDMLAAQLHAIVHNVAEYVSLEKAVICSYKVKEVQELMLNADRIIFVSPIHWLNISAVGKIWIEQIFNDGFGLNPDYSKPRIGGRKFMVIGTTGAPSQFYTEDKYGNAETLLRGYRDMCIPCHLAWQGGFLLSPDEDPAAKAALIVAAAK